MFLLIPLREIKFYTTYKKFTFHNVSINSSFCFTVSDKRIHLHSTMFLLILIKSSPHFRAFEFTFHNVSINSTILMYLRTYLFNLHSTMFLLIPFSLLFSTFSLLLFTFHNVSINSKLAN